MKKYFLPFFLFFTIGVVASVLYFGEFDFTKKSENVTSIFTTPSVTPIPTFSLERAPSESLRGEIVSLSGDIQWQSRIATEAAKIDKPISLQQGEDVSTGTDGKLVFDFNNAVNVSMAKNTDVGIVQTLPENIVFSQTTGNVVYQKTGTFPVSIRCKNLLVNVDEGQVNVVVNDINPNLITVLVNKGSTTVAYNSRTFVAVKKVIKEGKRFVFNNYTKTGL